MKWEDELGCAALAAVLRDKAQDAPDAEALRGLAEELGERVLMLVGKDARRRGRAREFEAMLAAPSRALPRDLVGCQPGDVLDWEGAIWQPATGLLAIASEPREEHAAYVDAGPRVDVFFLSADALAGAVMEADVFDLADRLSAARLSDAAAHALSATYPSTSAFLAAFEQDFLCRDDPVYDVTDREQLERAIDMALGAGSPEQAPYPPSRDAQAQAIAASFSSDVELAPATRAKDGSWEFALVSVDGHPPADETLVRLDAQGGVAVRWPSLGGEGRPAGPLAAPARRQAAVPGGGRRR